MLLHFVHIIKMSLLIADLLNENNQVNSSIDFMNSFPERIYFKDASKKRKKEEISDQLNSSLISSSEKNLYRKKHTQVILEKVSPFLKNDLSTHLCNNSLQLNVILKLFIMIHFLIT